MRLLGVKRHAHITTTLRRNCKQHYDSPIAENCLLKATCLNRINWKFRQHKKSMQCVYNVYLRYGVVWKSSSRITCNIHGFPLGSEQFVHVWYTLMFKLIERQPAYLNIQTYFLTSNRRDSCAYGYKQDITDIDSSWNTKQIPKINDVYTFSTQLVHTIVCNQKPYSTRALQKIKSICNHIQLYKIMLKYTKQNSLQRVKLVN